MAIDPTARIEDGARIGQDVSIGPFCVVGPHVTIGDGCVLKSHVSIQGHTAIGARTVVAPFASLGAPPQSVHYHGEPTRLTIGTDCDIREGVTMNIGTADGHGETVVGDRCFLMANAHVAHDCIVGDDVIFANCATLGGHCVIGARTFIGGLSAVHQFTHIGEGAMIAGVTGVRSDVIPFGLAAGSLASLAGLNLVGLKRRKVSRDSIHALRGAYRLLFDHEQDTFARRRDLARERFGQDELVARVLDFIGQARDRALCMPHRDGSKAE